VDDRVARGLVAATRLSVWRKAGLKTGLYETPIEAPTAICGRDLDRTAERRFAILTA
jgi:hypothetical protein